MYVCICLNYYENCLAYFSSFFRSFARKAYVTMKIFIIICIHLDTFGYKNFTSKIKRTLNPSSKSLSKRVYLFFFSISCVVWNREMYVCICLKFCFQFYFLCTVFVSIYLVKSPSIISFEHKQKEKKKTIIICKFLWWALSVCSLCLSHKIKLLKLIETNKIALDIVNRFFFLLQNFLFRFSSIWA